MNRVSSCILPAGVLCLLFASCTFNYGNVPDTSEVIPEMVIHEARADRYKNSSLSITFNAASLEMYDADRIWAAENISFTQYSSDGSGTVESEGSAGILMVDDAAEVYSLGNTASVRMISDKLAVTAPDLRWSKKTNRLSGPRNGEVEIRKDDGSVIRGTGFFADTLSRSYEFEETVTGQMVTGKPASIGADASGTVPESPDKIKTGSPGAAP